MLFGREGGVSAGCCRKRGAGGLLAVLLPGAAWLAMPKCPACLAGYLALVTGAGVSAGFTAGLRALVIFAALAAPLVFAVRLFKHHKNAKP